MNKQEPRSEYLPEALFTATPTWQLLIALYQQTYLVQNVAQKLHMIYKILNMIAKSKRLYSWKK